MSHTIVLFGDGYVILVVVLVIESQDDSKKLEICLAPCIIWTSLDHETVQATVSRQPGILHPSLPSPQKLGQIKCQIECP